MDYDRFCDQNWEFVTNYIMWRDFSDDINFVTCSSLICVHDQFIIFNDEGWRSWISTFLLVPNPLDNSPFWLTPFHLRFIVLQMFNFLTLSIYFLSPWSLDIVFIFSFNDLTYFMQFTTLWSLLSFTLYFFSYLFILLPCLLCIHLVYRISPSFSNNAKLWILSIGFRFQSIQHP
jgi:hypothetical protein